MSDEAALAFEAWEAELVTNEQARADHVRVRGYTLACIERAKLAHEELERRVTLLLRAQADAERALAFLRSELEHAEEMGRIVMLNAPDLNGRVAMALEELEADHGA
jgi:hypothetical protein